MMVVSTDKCRTGWFPFVVIQWKREVKRRKSTEIVDDAVCKASIQRYGEEILKAYPTVTMEIFQALELRNALVL